MQSACCPALPTRQINEYLARRRDDPKRPLSRSTRNRYLAALKTLCKAAIEWGFCMSNPASQVKMEREEQRIPDALTEEELDRLLEHVPYYLISLVIFAVDTGMRRAEIVRLIWSNVDFDQVQVTVGKARPMSFVSYR